MECQECGARINEHEDLLLVFRINPNPVQPVGMITGALISGYSHAWHYRNEES